MHTLVLALVTGLLWITGTHAQNLLNLPELNPEAACDAFTRRGSTESSPDAPDRVFPAERAECVENSAEHTCLIFSRALDTRLDAVRNGITIERTGSSGRQERLDLTPAAVRSNAVCYAHLSFGRSYRFTFGDALRAADGSALAGPRIALLEMPSKAPALGFKRGAYVLPASGSPRIALKTTNLTRADLMLRRIGDLNLIREVIAKHIIGGLAQEDACFVLNQLSEKIADGTLEMAATTYEENDYALPIGVILEKRREWLLRYTEGAKGEFSESDTTKKLSLKLDLHADRVAAETASAARAGIFILFGRNSDDGSRSSSGNRDSECPDGLASQWFVVTNIGLTLQRSHSNIYVVAREFDTGALIKDLQIEFLSRSGQRIETAKTDSNGIAVIPARLGRGTGGNELVAVLAYRTGDFAFLDMTSDAIDLADRGLGGVARQRAYDAFIAPSRGIFRPGEKIEAVLLVRGPDGTAVADLPPVEVALVKGDGIVLKRYRFSRENADFTRDGGFFLEMQVPEGTAEGPLSIEAAVDGSKIGSAAIEVQYYKPLTVRITPDKDSLRATLNERGQLRLQGTARADYLYGRTKQGGTGTDAPAAHLRGELQVRLEPAPSPVSECYEGFTFGRQVEETKAQIFQGPLPLTDNDGTIVIDFPQEGVLSSNVPLRSSMTMTLLDLNGRAAQGKFDVPVTHLGRRWLGVKPMPPTNPTGPTRFQFILLDDNKQPVHERIWLTIYKEQTDFVWSKDSTSWEYRPVPPARVQLSRFSPTVTRPSAPMQGSCPAVSTFEYRFDQPGRYLVEVTDDKSPEDKSRAITELSVGSGWTTASDGNIKPDWLRVYVVPNQAAVAPGKQLRVEIETPHEAGKVFGEILINGELKQSFESVIDRDPIVRGGRANATITVGRYWPAGSAHIYATSFRQSQNNHSFEAGPARAIGG
jgi:uncharacterized protein YfaS (alpha-2-macroglobulin family)